MNLKDIFSYMRAGDERAFCPSKKKGEERKKEGIVSKVEHEKSFTKIPLEKKVS